jgi:hypothetical protein
VPNILCGDYIKIILQGKIDPRKQENKKVLPKGGYEMRAKRGSIVSKQDFLKDGLYAKEEYEGLLVSSDQQQGCYNLGVQLDDFKIGLLCKDNVPGLLIRFDENGYYHIGIQINNTEVVKVASVGEDDAMAKIEYWADRIDNVKERYKDREAKLKPIGGQ